MMGQNERRISSMNQMEIGSFIAKKRKEKNYTQAILAEKLRVSNKTISKWETGKSMPDYAVIQNLCSELDISLSELMDAEENESNSIRPYDEEQILELIRRTQNLENQRTSLYGAILIVMGIALLTLSFVVGGSNLRDFCSGILLGLSIVEMLAGVYMLARGFSKQQ